MKFARDRDANEVIFEIGELIFTVRSDGWLHVADKNMNQENAFGYETFDAILTAVKDEYFTKTETAFNWFTWRDGAKSLYVEYYEIYRKSNEPHIIIHRDDGYRLHLSLGDFKILIGKLRELLDSRQAGCLVNQA